MGCTVSSVQRPLRPPLLRRDDIALVAGNEAEGTTFRGHDGARAWWETVRGAIQGARWELLDLQGSGDRGVARIRITGRLGGVPVEQTMWQAVRFRARKARWGGFFRTEDEAVKAAGLGERGCEGLDCPADS